MITNTLRYCAPLLAAVLFLAAAPPPVKAQVPGYWRMAIGSFEVTALYDGNLRMQPSILHGIDAAAVPRLLEREFVDTNASGVLTSISAYLVNTGEHLVLVDTGSAGNFSNSTGHLVENLRAAGYRPEDVDTILITHMHGDHVGGLLGADGTPAFPKAEVYAAEAEAGFWLAPRGNDALENWKDMSRKALRPYQAAGKFHTFRPGKVILPGITAMDTHGHTPGHISYLFESGDQGFLAMGDIVHMHAVQFVHPEVSMDYDTDQPTAIVARKALFNMVAEKRWMIGATHLPFPGLGHIRREGAAFSYVPAEYAP